MAKLILESIGGPRETFLDDETWKAQRQQMTGLAAELQAKRDEVRAGWGEKYLERVRERGKLPRGSASSGSRTPTVPSFPSEPWSTTA